MSELIDNVFDVKAIEKQYDEVKAILDTLKKDMSGYAASIDDIMKATRSSKTGDDLTKNAKELNNVITMSKATLDSYNKSEKELINIKAKLAIAKSQQNKN